mgnify:CR=1 FL=1
MNAESSCVSNDSRKDPVAKYTAKDSVFTNLFSDPKYLLQLYKALHPEDLDATEENISNVTIQNILLDQSYNDLGFQVGTRLVVLVEAQSSWTVNIVLRSLMYLTQTWQKYIQNTGQNVYGSKKVELPRPELYVIYTGNRKIRPKSLRLSEEFWGGDECAVEVKVKMIYDGEKGDIISQYVSFTRIYNEQIKLHGRTREAVLETIRICRDRNILKDYLESREQEVVNIMMTLFDEEYILKTYIEQEKRDAAEEAERKAKEAAKETARKLYQKGTSVADIADAMSLTEEEIKQWLGLVSSHPH